MLQFEILVFDVIFSKFRNAVSSTVFSCLVVTLVMLGVSPILNRPSILGNGVINGLHNLKGTRRGYNYHVVYNSLKKYSLFIKYGDKGISITYKLFKNAFRSILYSCSHSPLPQAQFPLSIGHKPY